VIIVVAVITEQYYLLSDAEAMTAAAAEAGDVAVSASAVVESGALSASSYVVGGVVGGAAGNLAGQALGNMIGTQHGFNFGAFASAAIGGAVGGMLGGSGAGVGQQMLNGGVNNAISQGINIVTGQQEKFDWRGVVAAAISAPFTSGIGRDVGNATNSKIMARIAAGVVREGISAAVHGGGRINFVQLAADAFGNVIGNDMVAQLNGAGTQQTPVLANAYDDARAASALANAQANPVGLMSDSGQYLGTSPELDAGYRMYRTQGADWPTDLGSEWAALAGGGFNAGDVSDAAGSAGAARQQDLSTREGMDNFLREVRAKNVMGGELTPAEVVTAKALLSDKYGYAMGELRGNQADLAESLDETRTAAFTRALENYAGNSAAQNQERFDLYSNIKVTYDENGNETNGRYVDITRDGRTIRMNWDSNFAALGNQMGISTDEALRKVDFRAYKDFADAAFQSGVRNSITMNGGWRPTKEDLLSYFGSEDAASQALARSGFSPNLKNYQDGPHMDGRGLDFNLLDGTSVNRVTFNSPQPDIVRDFSYALKNIGGDNSQVIGPWMTYGVNPIALGTGVRQDMGNRFIQNILNPESTVETGHRYHGHFTLPR